MISSRSFSTTVFFSGVDRNHCQLFGVTAFFKRGYTVWEVRHVFVGGYLKDLITSK